MKIFCRSILAGLFMLCFTNANAQTDQNNLISAPSSGTSSTNFFFARPNEITMIVNVMGYIQRPGRYEISSSIDLMNLISLAGGPASGGSLSKVKIIRMVKNGENTLSQEVRPDQQTLSAFIKEEVKTTRQEIWLDLENLLTVRAEDLQLKPGDVVFVDRTTWSSVQDVLAVIVPAVLVTSAVMQIIDISKR